MTRRDYLDRYDAVCRAEEALDTVALNCSPEHAVLLHKAYVALSALRLDFWDRAYDSRYWES
jgi:hypothetical protein